jgi:hypothetical protein
MSFNKLRGNITMPFGDSDPRIYNKMIVDGAIKKWNNNDWYSILAPLESLGFSWEPRSMTMKPQGVRRVVANTPWIHACGADTKRCQMDHNIMFNLYGIIPKRCMDCWKVVVTPKSFKELMQLEWLQKKMEVPSKCGIELRDYTPKFYGGYFYNNSVEEGQACYERVKDAVAKDISKKTAEGVILKRGCTEFEMVNGPSPFWHITKEQDDFCRAITNYVRIEQNNHEQAKIMQNQIHLKWVLWAHMNNDMSYKEFNGDKALFPGYVTYHKQDVEDIKRDLAVGQAFARDGVEPEVTSAFLTEAIKFAEHHKIHPQSLTTMLGSNNANPLGWADLRKETPDEVKGDLDELQ